ncbi:MAG: WecB/TagA/CpsF family glycosyltransferase [Candidatus Heimdallarchaeota archaeon]|nr:WecB/TagA/CpsF family glycosyltransferase [Candidatus Heimdallarchaeota archaeon]
MKDSVKILNIDVDNITMNELLTSFDSGFLVTPNVDHLMQLQKNRAFYDVYKQADYVTVDSQIVYWATRFLGHPVKEKISGSDIFPAYCNFHKNNPDVRMFLLGGRTGVATQAANNTNVRVGRKIVIGAHSPSMNFVNDTDECGRVIEQINSSGANVLVVGLGAPKQELWISEYRKQMPNIHSFMALGATLDFEAGTLSRAPQWVSRFGLEWLYRLFQDPGRLWKRYLVRDVPFFYLLLKQKLGFYKSPFYGG